MKNKYLLQKKTKKKHLGKSRPPSLWLDGDSFGSALQDLVDIFLTELGTLIFLVHERAVRAAPQQVLDLFLRELLLHRLQGGKKGRVEWVGFKKNYVRS